MPAPANPTPTPDETIHGHGLRMTGQRRAVYDVLMGERNHPTAVEVFTRVRATVPNISLATVYNCLDTLTACGIVKTVSHEREPARYCPNLDEHAHFFCQACGAISDIPEPWYIHEDLVVFERRSPTERLSLVQPARL